MRFDVHTSQRTFFVVAGGLYVVLVLACAILPAASMERQFPTTKAWVDPRITRGSDLYKSYGCIYCHTMQIRGDERLATEGPDGTLQVPVLKPDRRFGLDHPSYAEEYRNDDPPFLGTERIGPDLLAVGTRLPSAAWHYWHLYDPRAVSPDSNMPSLPWLFHTEDTKQPEDEKVAPLFDLDVPKGRLYATPDAQALVEYLLSRTRPESTR